MITIYIESDDGDNNLRNVDSSLVKTHEECLLLMHYAWLKSNVSSETYQFNVYSSLDDHNELLEIGKYVIPRGSSEVEIFDVDNQDSIEQFDKAGFSIKHQKAINHDDRLFWARFDFIDNPNNHHLLLGNWLRQIDEEIDLYWLIEESTGINDSEITDEKVGDVILASLLYFAAQNNKKVEMLDWLLGDEGIQYFENFDEYNLEAKKLLNAVKVIGSKLTKNSDKNLLINQLIETSLVQSIPLPKIF